MLSKHLAPLTVNELRNLLRRDPRFRKDLERLHLKLTPSGRLVGTKKDSCVAAHFQPADDPLILKRGAAKSRKTARP